MTATASQGARILLTGATGFLGTRVLAQLAARGDIITALVRPGAGAGLRGCTVVEADLSGDFTPALGKVGEVDAVIHLAQAPGWHDFPRHSAAVSAVCVTAACRLAEHAAKVGAGSFVYASSGGVYGPGPEPILETAPLKPAAELGFYLSAKITGERLLSFFAPHLAVQTLRPFFVYGPGQKPDFLFARLIRSVREGTPIRLAQGRGPRLNPVFVDDAAAAVVAAADRRLPLTANIAGPEVIELVDIARRIGAIQGREPVFTVTDDLADGYVADIAAMRRTLIDPGTGIAEGLAQMMKDAES